MQNGKVKGHEEAELDLEQILSSIQVFEEEQNPSRNIYLYEEIERHTALKVARHIEMINDIDDELEARDIGYVRQPVNLFIDTYGGYISAGSAIITAIKRSKTKIVGVVTGNCYSMGIPILLACDTRYASSLASFMIHSVSVEAMQDTSLTGYKYQVENTEIIQEMVKKYMERELGDSTFYNDIVDGTKDTFFNSEIALEQGIIHATDYELMIEEEVTKEISNSTKKESKSSSRKWKAKSNK